MSRKKPIIWKDTGQRFPSLTAAAAYFGTDSTSIERAIFAGRKYKGQSLVYEGTQTQPRDSRKGNRSNHAPTLHPNCKAVSEFRNGELFRVYPSRTEAARQMGMTRFHLCDVLKGKYANNTGKDFAPATPLDECLMEIRERNKRPYIPS